MSTPQLLVTTSQSAGSRRYSLLVAEQQAEVRAAQRLRHRVFAGEMGAVLHSSQPGLDVDEFDAHCNTWCGLASGRFRPAVFQAAVGTATPVRPVALRYRLAGVGATTVASFVGSATLWEAVVLVAGVRGLVVEVHLLPLLPADGSDRRALAARAQAAVTVATLPPTPQLVATAPALRAA